MKKHLLTALLSVMLVLLLCLPASGASFVERLFSDDSTEAPEPEATLSPEAIEAVQKDIPASKLKDDGVIRVWIKSLGNLNSLELTLQGNYTLNGEDMRLEDGTRLYISEGGDALYLSVGGFSMKLGESAELIRHESAHEDSGVYIAESGYSGLFPGDLTLTRNGEGGIRCVMKADVEEYLRGVIAYEMSESWPVEALKAQAVAARTYAAQAKQDAKERDYDVTNTTSDQVFKSVDPGFINVTEAVRATEGVVGTYNGTFAKCWYTASNGGQTALPKDVWSGNTDEDGHLARTEDPYDLANPMSVIKSYSFDFDLSDAPELKALLMQGLDAQAASLGYAPGDLEIEEVSRVYGVEPYAEESLMYHKLRFELYVTAPRQVYRPVEGDNGPLAGSLNDAEKDLVPALADGMRRLLDEAPYAITVERDRLDAAVCVDLDAYRDVKQLPGLSIDSADCELYSCTSDGFSFTIEARRFGHGVGMSQRGAQRMAGTEGKSWREILAFYYPGMDLERVDWDTPALPAWETATFSTESAPVPTPTPGPLPELTEGESYATVILGDASSTLNMRAKPTTQAEVAATLSNGQRLIVCGATDSDGWVAVRTAEASGYVREEYLKRE